MTVLHLVHGELTDTGGTQPIGASGRHLIVGEDGGPCRTHRAGAPSGAEPVRSAGRPARRTGAAGTRTPGETGTPVLLPVPGATQRPSTWLSPQLDTAGRSRGVTGVRPGLLGESSGQRTLGIVSGGNR
jgi:hypothetical protein